MSLDVTLFIPLYDEDGNWFLDHEVYTDNITHNLGQMAEACSLYLPLWRPEEMSPRVSKAKDIIPFLEEGFKQLNDRSNDPELMKLSPENGWGTYEYLRLFVKEYLKHCRLYPKAEIHVSR